MVRQVFDHLEGTNLPFDSKTNNVSFAAKDNVFATAIYRPDYTYLMPVIALPVTGIFAIKKSVMAHLGMLEKSKTVWTNSFPNY